VEGDLISRSALLKAKWDWCDAEDAIRDAPAIDAELVVHARWQWDPNGSGGAYCPACKRVMNPVLYGYARCALCGAKMDGQAT
jgi:hypothetical protein